jgi:hypothetical protein
VTTITLVRRDDGKLGGASEKDQRAYRRFRDQVDGLEPGGLFTLDVWFPRQGWLHRKHFAMLAQVYDMQEQFQDPDALRMWLQVGAGHCEFVPGPTGKMVAIPKSIRYSAMDDADFEEHCRKVREFLRSDHARRFLYPHLPEQQSADMIDALLADFEA